MGQPQLFYPRQICVPFRDLSRGSLHGYVCADVEWRRHPRRSAPMSNQRRRFLGLAAGAIAVPGTSSLLVAQGDPSRGREAPIPAQASVPERRPAKSELTGLSALLTPGGGGGLLFDH